MTTTPSCSPTSIRPGSPRASSAISKERWGTAGWRGEFDNGLTWDLSGTLAKNTLTLSMYNSLSPTYGPDTQTSFEFGTLSQKEHNANLDMTYPINVGLFQPADARLGRRISQGNLRSEPGRPAILWRRSVRGPAGAL